MKMDMVYVLESKLAIVLYDVVVLGASSNSDFFNNWADITEIFVGEISNRPCVILGNHLGVPLRYGIDVEECQTVIRLVDFEAWDSALDDKAKNALFIRIQSHDLDLSFAGLEGPQCKSQCRYRP